MTACDDIAKVFWVGGLMTWCCCRCLTSRELLKHHQKCTATDCPVCTPVKQYVQKQRMAMQKQQQESLRQREAERQRYGESRMQVFRVAYPCVSQ